MVTAVLAALPVAVGLALAALPIVLIPVALAAKRPAGVARALLGGWILGSSPLDEVGRRPTRDDDPEIEERRWT